MTGPEHRLTVLVVEDDETMRSVLCRTMKSEGYEVSAATDGQDALTLLAEPPRVDVIVTDICMPKMDGRELGLVLAERHPEIPLLFISAYADSVVPAALPGPLLRKPFRPSELIGAVRQLVGIGNESPDTATAPIPVITWKPAEDTDRAVRTWMKAKGWEVTGTNYDIGREIYAWRHELPAGNSPTLRISRRVLEDYPAFMVLHHLDELKVAQAIRARPEARLVMVQKGLTVTLDESP